MGCAKPWNDILDVHCQDLRFLHLMHSPKIQRPTIMLLSTHHCGSSILVVIQGMCGTKKFDYGKDVLDMD